MKVAALDLGTNSFLCLIADVQNGRIEKVDSDQVQVVRLGQDVQKTKKFHPEALQRARICLAEFKKTIEQYPVQKVLAMATAAARDVENADALFQIGRDLNIPIEIIPGSREVEITFQGAISGHPTDHKTRLVIDIGGGSTEVITGNHQKILGGESVNIGAVRLTEMFFPSQPPTKSQVENVLQYIEEQMKPVLDQAKSFAVDEVIAVAGTPTELAAVTLGEFDPQKIDGFQFDEAELTKWIDRFLQTTPEERVANFGISKGRADVILAGTLILRSILQSLNAPRLIVSTRGVRYGIALELEKRN